MVKGKMAPPLSLPTRPLKEMTNDPEGMSLTVRSNPGKVQEPSAHGSSNGAGHGAAKSTSHDSSNSMDICQQRSSPVQCLERDVRARSPSKSMAFHGVPEDVYVHFLQYMSVQNLSKVSQVSRQLRKQCQCNTMWRNLCLQDYGEDAPKIVDTYRDSFAQIHDSNAAGFYQRIYRSMLDFRIDIAFLAGPRANEEPCKISKIETTNIGRSRQNDICILQDEMVSRKHGKIIPKARRYMLQDLGSINGTFINTKQVQTQSTVQLRLGDEVEMGNSVFKIVLVVPNPNEDEEATTVVEDHDIEQLQNDEEMGDDDDILPHDDEEDAYEQDLDDMED
mmetsp:Transcript_31286/g.45774  ORF Transcript_31286/g.45774 Transcript_31286/m.45774 type:complete len:334 (-) Transcript_31286:297-1298(-)